jgi:hypothetical protein
MAWIAGVTRRARLSCTPKTLSRRTAATKRVAACTETGRDSRAADARLVRAPIARAPAHWGTCDGIGPAMLAPKIPKNRRNEASIH